MREKLIINAIDVPIGEAIETVRAINIEKQLAEQIDDNCIIVTTGAHVVYIETKRRKSIRIDVSPQKKPESNWTDITHDKEVMDRVLKGVAKMQNEILRKAEEIKKAEGK